MTTRDSTPVRARVLHVYKDYFPPVMGGVELTINLLAEGCRDEFDVTVLVNSGNRSSFEEVINGVRVVRISEWGRAASAPFSPAFVSALAREARRADLLHFHHPNPTGDLARFLARPAPPCVMTYHSDVVRQRWAMAAYGPLQEWMMRHCRVIMPTSPQYLSSSPWLTRHRDRCTVVPLGIRVEQFEENQSVKSRAREIQAAYDHRPLVLFVGRLRYYKGLQFLVEATPLIPPDAHVVIAGTGPVESDLRQQAKNLGVEQRVHFLGDISDAEKIAWYHAATVFCMPSHLRSEAFGLSQVEAMASGLPVVSCDIPSGVPFVNQDGVSGVTVPPCDPRGLADGINRVLGNDELRTKLATGARQRSHIEFTAERMTGRVIEVYRQVLG